MLCGERGIRTPGAFQLNSFQDCRNRPLYHLSNIESVGVSPKRIAKIEVFYEIANFFAKISVWIFKKNCCGLSGGGGSVFLQEKLAVEEQKVEGTDCHATVSEVEYCAEEGVDGI